ncbi:hypothetical protein NDU88_010117 [Pleurodeles waltl]|uniref:Uncharacterized protein n=1 Tax=Pleurodeles waltl TaxID=8319 RepID=A0AAV7PX50_PLEWA|nr:hypothetical protein NDU88_010117 [Pleurodeles waltl]
MAVPAKIGQGGTGKGGAEASGWSGGKKAAGRARVLSSAGGGGGGKGVAGSSGEQRDPLVPISKKWPTMLVWSSEDDEGAMSGEGNYESAGEGPSTVGRSGAPGQVSGPLGGAMARDEEVSSEEEEAPGADLVMRQVIGGVGLPGTPDLFEHGPLDFEEDDPGEQGAALLPWEEEKAGPRAASRMASTGRRSWRRRAADASGGLCGREGVTPPDAAAWEEQRLGSENKWLYEGESAGCVHCSGSSVRGLRKGLDEEDRMSEVTLEEGELRTSGSESEWWERQGRGVANPVRKSLQVPQVARRAKASQERLGEQRKVQERPPLLSPGHCVLPCLAHKPMHTKTPYATLPPIKNKQSSKVPVGTKAGLLACACDVNADTSLKYKPLLPRDISNTVDGATCIPNPSAA